MTKRTNLRLIAALSLSAALSLVSFTSAAASCTSRDAMLDRLNNKFVEKLRAIGMISQKGVIEVLVSKTGSWTIIMTMANGRSCMMAAGKNWEQLAIPTEDGPAA